MKTTDITPVFYEFLSEKDAMARTPYQTARTFREHYGDLYRAPENGKAGGYLASDLQARTEQFPTQSRNPRDKA